MCQFEDSINCVWLAAAQGNGQGTSFVNIAGNVYPLFDTLLWIVLALMILGGLFTIFTDPTPAR